ncbi:MAG: translation initiation factor IF-2 [Ruminococcaceae bacterium]|nr:translation initiation factor IF-2 [Oscillospiraceae bacterium]
MATNPKQIKINMLAKDFNMKTKDVIDILAAAGIDKKTSGTIDADEFSVFLNHATINHQVTNMSDYLAGKADIPKETMKKNEPVKSESNTKTPKAKTTGSGNASKETATKNSAEKESTSKTLQSKTPAVKAPLSQVVEMKEEQSSVVSVKETSEKSVSVKEETVKETPMKETSAKENVKEMPKRENTTKTTAPVKSSVEPKQLASEENKHSERNHNERNTNVPQKTFASNRNESQNTERRQQNHSPKTTENAQNRPQFAQKQNQNVSAQQNQQSGSAPRSQQRTQQYSQPAQQPARPIPQPQPQKPKEKKEQQPLAPKTTRIVDTRTTSVDLSKYDERLENFVPESARRNNAPDRQKLKKQQNQNPYAKGSKDKKNAPDKLKKQEIKKTQLSVTIPDEITVSELAQKLKVTASEVIKRLMMMGVMATVNQTVDYDTAFFVADELGAKVTKEVVVTIEEKLFDEEPVDTDLLETRPPVVCVMGHVDHGKTSLLDAIRNTHVTAGEAGGITQHIGAYRVNCNGQYITFLDTPGHEAFTAMRARGAKSTDIAILVVAADDGIMPQTVEAINHARAAKIPIIVAINKIDKPTANPDAIKTELTKYDLVPEEWGGDVICVPVSALRGDGISDLLENVLLVAEVEDFKADPKRRAKGIVIEAKLDRGRGPVASVLIQNGTLHTGDTVIVGTAVGHVRAMTNDKGQLIKEAGPSVPVEIIGLDSVPSAGDEINAVEDERMAKELAEQRRQKEKEEIFKANAKVNLDDLFAQMAEGVKDLNIIVKADVKGSAEAVKASLEKLTNDEVKVNVIHTGVGGIIEGDVTFAAASNAIIVGFNVRPDKMAMDSAELQGVDIRTYRIIYECIEEITAAIKGMLKPVYREVILGHAEVRQTIHVPNVGMIAGSYITDGKVTRASLIRVVRDGVIIFEDKISSLRRFKDDVKEVASGYECGIGLEKFNDIKENDVLEAYIMEQVER